MKCLINGAKNLRGSVWVQGAKNAALPIIAATLLMRGPSTLRNVPRIRDVESMLEILRLLGCTAQWQDDLLIIDTDKATFQSVSPELSARLRASVLMLGPMLGRFGRAQIARPGGCAIGARPVDVHLAALAALGANIEQGENLVLSAPQIRGAPIVLSEISVTATENAMMAAVTASGRSTIDLAACEPHVADLAAFLNKGGAMVKGAGTHHLDISGVFSLTGASHQIIPDQIEAGMMYVLQMLGNSCLEVWGHNPYHMACELMLLPKIRGTGRLNAFRLQTMPYPGFPTDLQSAFTVLATQCHGDSLIHDPLYENRFSYVDELVRMGARIDKLDAHRIMVHGPTPLHGASVSAKDLRGGGALLLAGLIATGQTEIDGFEHVERGHQDLPGRLSAIGADIRLVN